MIVKDYNEFLHKLEGQILIYGAGRMGKMMHDFLKLHNVYVSAFVVTAKQKDNRMVSNTPVLCLDDALLKFPNALIIIGVMVEKQHELIANLDNRAVENYIVISEALLYEIRYEVLKYQAENTFFHVEKHDGRFTIGYLYPGYIEANYAERRLVLDRVKEGGKEMLSALSKYEDKHDFKLTLISSLQSDSFTHATYQDIVEVKNIIKTKKWIEYYDNIPNDEVLEKCRQSTVGLLPSMADTYGYAVLEMQAAGCPVITTNIRAFLEINNEECGWICNLPVDDQKKCNQKNLRELSVTLKNELENCFAKIFENPDSVYKKGRKAMERIQKMHDPKEYSDKIKNVLL